YQRTTAIDRHLRARDRHCRWPGCITPAIRCEIDHTHDFALGGPTDVTNLAHLCQRHHTQKQFTRWTVNQQPGGVLQWTSPTGRTYIDEPLPYSPA
ncbi:HNH endonuclease, partial [Streptococcus pneumoniae]|nr:HNH endonuclease [Streptococcus pneumoniae]